MEKVQMIDYKGKKIIEMDFQNYTFKDIEIIREIIEQSKKVIAAQPPNSALTLTNVTGLRFSPEIVEVFSKFTEFNKPYVKQGALVGIVGLLKVAYNAVMKFSGRNIQLFQERQEAMDWLVQQD